METSETPVPIYRTHGAYRLIATGASLRFIHWTNSEALLVLT